MKRITLSIALFLYSSLLFVKAQSSSEIYLKMQKLNVLGSALYIAAHPDDENTRLLSYLANEKKWRTAYLSLTRGDGGQNLIGTEQSEKLGMIRTQELLAARRIDGAEQFFTRAFDFGFSKNPEETFRIWKKDSVLADMVWVIRNFQPDVIITRFPTDGSGGHGHHTASALLAEEAMDAAADPNQFKEQLIYVKPWKVKRLVWNGFNFGNAPQSDGKDFTKLDIGDYNELLGKSYGEIASMSRSQHKSQGFGVPMQRGSIKETFRYVKGDSVKSNILEGVDDSWSRLQGSKTVAKLMQKLLKEYNPIKPDLSIPMLQAVENELMKLENSYWRNQKLKEVQDLIFACAGLFYDSYGTDYVTNRNEQLNFSIQAINRSSQSIKLIKVKTNSGFDTVFNTSLESNVLLNYSTQLRVSENTSYSNPYWLIEKPSQGLFHVAHQQLIGVPNPIASLQVEYTFEINAKRYTSTRSLKYKWTDPVKGELQRDVEVLPAVSVNALDKNIILGKNETSKTIKLSVNSFKAIEKGILRIRSNSNVKVSPAEIEFSASQKNAVLNFEFEIGLISNAAQSIELIPEVIIGDKMYSSKVERIEYDHIPVQVQVLPTKIRLEKTDILVKGKRAGYIVGAGDEIPEALKQLGFEVTMIDDAYLNTKDLKDFDVIVAGIRLYNTNENMKNHYEKLMKYVADGGNYVVQYNTSNFISAVSSKVGPYDFQITRDRITDEQAKMNFVNPADRILNYPNKISEQDFDQWVQERGLYFLSKVDPKYRKVFSGNDPNEKTSDGILITCAYGKGTFTYTGISFFRQLPAGVPGAYKLFANIISQSR